MGGGYHGGFGNTSGNLARFRIGKPVKPTEKNYRMALDPEYYIDVITKKYNIHLKGSGKTIKVVFNPDLRSSGMVRKVAPNIIEIRPLALSNETELANTIAHELNHARSFLKGGNAPESKAYYAGNRLEEYMKGMR